MQTNIAPISVNLLAKMQIQPENTGVSVNPAAPLAANRPEQTGIGYGVQTASKTTTSRISKLPKENFLYRGRKWRIFKRSQGPDANWNFYFEFQKQRNGPWSLGSASKQHAITEAKLKIDLFFQGREASLRGSLMRPQSSRDFSPLPALIGRWNDKDDTGVLLTVPTKKMASESTRLHYGWSLRWCLRLALGLDDRQLDELNLGVLNKDTVRKFFDAVATAAAKLPTQKEQNSYVRSAYNFYNHARALLAPRPAEALVSTFGLKLPDLKAWRDGLQVYGRSVAAVEACELPSDTVIRHTLREWIRLARTPGYQMPGGNRSRDTGTAGCDLPIAPLSDIDRRNLFIAIGLELSCGLRAGEVQRVCRHWITTEAGLPLLRCSDTAAKNKSGKIEVSPLDPFWKVLWFWIRKNHWDVASEQLLLQARTSAAGKVLKADVNYWPEALGGRWLRWLGWQTQKTNHALRDYSASMITMRYGIGEACDWCRHATISTTERHYNRFAKLSKRLDPRKLAWLRWAK